jgi:hypothetical protein
MFAFLITERRRLNFIKIETDPQFAPSIGRTGDKLAAPVSQPA